MVEYFFFFLFGAPNLPYLYLISTRIALFLRELSKKGPLKRRSSRTFPSINRSAFGPLRGRISLCRIRALPPRRGK